MIVRLTGGAFSLFFYLFIVCVLLALRLSHNTTWLFCIQHIHIYILVSRPFGPSFHKVYKIVAWVAGLDRTWPAGEFRTDQHDLTPLKLRFVVHS